MKNKKNTSIVKNIISKFGRKYRLNNQRVMILNYVKNDEIAKYYSDDIVFEQNVYFFFWDIIKKYQKEIKMILRENLNITFEDDVKVRFEYDFEVLEFGVISKSNLIIIITELIKKYKKLNKIITDSYPLIIYTPLCKKDEQKGNNFLYFGSCESFEIEIENKNLLNLISELKR